MVNIYHNMIATDTNFLYKGGGNENEKEEKNSPENEENDKNDFSDSGSGSDWLD